MAASGLKDGPVSLWQPIALKDKIETCARLTGRTKIHLAMEALNDYLD